MTSTKYLENRRALQKKYATVLASVEAANGGDLDVSLDMLRSTCECRLGLIKGKGYEGVPEDFDCKTFLDEYHAADPK